MLGIEDKWVLTGYLACVGSTLLCVIYGLFCWNRGQETPKQEDIHWAQEEQKAEEEL
jgi:hypothetical protein